MNYTIREAAEALGIAKRTLQRRIAAGELPAKLAQRGKQAVRVIDGADLAAFAQAEGYTLPPPMTPPTAEPVTERDTSTAKPPPTPDSPCPACRAAEATAAAQERLIAHLQSEVQFLRGQLAALTVKALPDPTAGSWWARLTGKGRKA